MNKPYILIVLIVFVILWCVVSCTSSPNSGHTETTTAVYEVTLDLMEVTSEEITFEEVTSEAETIEEETTKSETLAEATTEDDPYIEKLEFSLHSYINADFFDYQMTYIPSDQDFEKLQQGMTIAEVIEIVGRPHGLTNDNNRRLYWFSTGNYTYFISRNYPRDKNGERIRTYSIFEEYALSTFYKYEKYKITKPVLEGLYALLEDPRYKTLPLYEDLINIPLGTTFQEIVELYGKPQSIEYYKGTNASKKQYSFYVFYTEEGINVGIRFLAIQPEEDLDVEHWYAVLILNLGRPDHYCLDYKFPEIKAESP